MSVIKRRRPMNYELEDADMLPMIERAILYATVKHSEACRKGTTIPYITHVIEAMEIVSRITDDEEVRAATVLHDTVEDADVTEDEIAVLFGPRVAALVSAESEDKREDQPAEETWKVRKKETISRLKDAGTDTRMIALGDKLSNARAMYRDYQISGDKIWKKFNQKDPREQGWYYRKLAKVFEKDKIIGPTEACREYRKLVDQLFKKYKSKRKK